MIDCSCLTPFSTVFQLCNNGQCTYPCFPGVLLTSTPPVAIINPWKESWPSWGSNQRPPVLKSAMLPAEQWGSASLGRRVQLDE